MVTTSANISGDRKNTMGNESMTKQLGSLSKDEIELVMQFRARQERRGSPARRALRLLSLLATFGILVVTVIFYIQAVEVKNNGYKGEVPAPLSWILAITTDMKS